MLFTNTFRELELEQENKQLRLENRILKEQLRINPLKPVLTELDDINTMVVKRSISEPIAIAEYRNNLDNMHFLVKCKEPGYLGFGYHVNSQELAKCLSMETLLVELHYKLIKEILKKKQ